MKKQTLLELLKVQTQTTKKSTRKDIITFVRDMVEYHIPTNAEVNGISPARTGGVNLGEVMEVVAKATYNNPLAKAQSNALYDLNANGERVEVKFSSSDAYAHPINPSERVDWYMIITYTKGDGLQVFKVPYAKRNEIRTNAQGRVITNQLAKFYDRQLTERLTPRG